LARRWWDWGCCWWWWEQGWCWPGGWGCHWGGYPGDFAWKGKHVQVFFPLGTSIAVSVVLTVVLWLLMKMRK
jgi:hypothetical protein